MAATKRSTGDTFDPVDYYRQQLDGAVLEAAKKAFEEKLARSGVNEDENASDCRKLRRKEQIHETEGKKLSSLKGWRGFCIFLLVVAIIVAILGGLIVGDEGTRLAGIIMLVVGIVLGIAMFLVILLVLNDKIRKLNAENQDRERELERMRAEIRAKLAPLYNSFRWDDFKVIANSVSDIFQIDERFPQEKMNLMREIYSYGDLLEEEDSVVALMSGDIGGNPFFRIAIKGERIVDIRYTGSLTISWTERYTDSEGHVHTTVRTETLHAEYYHPGPRFTTTPVTVYGNMAAPDLSFSRNPCGIDTSDERELRSFVKKEEGRLRDKSEEMTKKGKTFTPLSNTEFEALFGAYDRDHEVQFRLLFTPLAQQNMLELIKGKEGFGDDFLMRKAGTVNLVQSRHSSEYFSYDFLFAGGFLSVEEMRKAFVEQIRWLYKSLYFDLAPFLAIPLYQMTDAGRYDPKNLGRTISDYEAMRVVNGMDPGYFKNPRGATDQILRVKYQGTVGKSDRFAVNSLSFSRKREVTFVPVMGGDGHFHNVPVEYFVYEPVTAVHGVSIRRMGLGNERYSKDALLHYLSGKGVTPIDSFIPLRAPLDQGDCGELDLEDYFENLDERIEEKIENIDKDIESALEKKDKEGD